MNFTSQMRYNPETGEYEKYYRLKESYRNASGRACTRILLNGQRYIVCDPTYIGAPVGLTMPNMDNNKASVILLD